MWNKLTLTALLAALATTPLLAQDRLPLPQPGPGRYYDRDRDNRDRIDRRDRDDRQVWVYDVDDGGSFEKGRGDRWVQYRNTGTPINFREVRRTRDYVELIDEVRQLPVRLYGDMLYQDLGGGFAPGFAGRWR